jgi:hypothetical protein
MINCALCSREFKKMTLTHLFKSHGLTMDEYRVRFPDAILVDEISRAAFSAKMMGRSGWKPTDEQKQHLSEVMTVKYVADPTYRDRISAGTKTGMNKPEARAKFDAYIATRDTSGEHNSFFGKHHTDEAKRVIGENEVRNSKIAAKRVGWWGAHTRQTVEQLYGEEVGARIRQQMSERVSGELNPAFGKVYDGAGRGKVGRYKNLLFRSSWEYSFYKYLEIQGYDLQTQIVYEPIRISYRFNEHSRTYTPDFLLGPEKLIIEVKTINELQREVKQELNNAKFAAAREFCTDKGLEFKVMTENDFPIVSYALAFRDPDVVWLRGGPMKCQNS